MLFNTPPSIGQFAINGIWEAPLAFEIDKPVSIYELKKYLANGNELAFELFFGTSFFGIRFVGATSYILDLSEHCLTSLNKIQDLNAFLTTIEEHPSIGKLCQKISYAEIGAVNAWKSVGSFMLPTPAQALLKIDELWSEISTTQLINNDTYPKAIEIAYTFPHAHWLGLPISSNQYPYSLNKELLRKALQKFIP